MNHLEIHARLAGSPVRHTADHLGDEPRQTERVGEGIHVLLGESVEGEHHHRLPLAGMALLDQRRRVVRVEKLRGEQPAVRDLAGQARQRSSGRCVAEDAPEAGHLRAHLIGDLGLLRGRVEDTARIGSVADSVVADGNAERLPDGARVALDDGPVLTAPPPNRQAVLTRPGAELDGAVPTAHGRHHPNLSGAGGAQVRGVGQQAAVGAANDVALRMLCGVVGDEQAAHRDRGARDGHG